MNIPRVDPAALRTIATTVLPNPETVFAPPFDDPGALIKTAADRLDVLTEALRVVLQEAIPSGTSGPYMLTRDTMAKIAAVWSPGLEALQKIHVKSKGNLPLTQADVDEALAALREVQSGDQGGG